MNGTFPPGQREPLNIIISGASDGEVLDLNEDKGGILNYFLCVPYLTLFPLFLHWADCAVFDERSLHFSGECLGQNSGNPQKADLGDGNGYGAFRRRHPSPSLSTHSYSPTLIIRSGPSGGDTMELLRTPVRILSRDHRGW